MGPSRGLLWLLEAEAEEVGAAVVRGQRAGEKQKAES